MQNQLTGLDLLTPTQVVHQFASIRAAFLGVDLPSDDLAAEHVEKQVEVKIQALNRGGQIADVPDLADLFRATLRDSYSPLRLKEELELTRIYQRIEQLRLGERLQVRWDVATLPMRAFVPGLTVQPLLENAIYHGIEPLETGGTVLVSGRVTDGEVEIAVTNPVAPKGTAGDERPGNRLALENIRQRLALAYGPRGSLNVEEEPGQYRVTIRFPFAE
jgi:two-component system sensor histidine kinase AlgZ